MRPHWGKKNKEETCYHPVISHCVDSICVARELMENVFSDHMRDMFSSIFDASFEDLIPHVMFLVGSHDNGKISENFALKSKRYGNLSGLPSRFGENDDIPLFPYHGDVSAITFTKWMDKIGVPRENSSALSSIIGGHHTKPLTSMEMKNTRSTLIGEDPSWEQDRFELIDEIRRLTIGDSIPLTPKPDDHVGILLLSGFIVICDWLASDEEFFSFKPESNDDIDSYMLESSDIARRIVKSSGWLRWKKSERGVMSFSEMYPDFKVPRKIQVMADEISKNFTSKNLLILIEAPTGDGKSEAAYVMTNRLIHNAGCRGCHLLMQNRASATAMFDRFKEVIEMTFDDAILNLIQGMACFDEKFKDMRSQTNEEDEEKICTEEWFSNAPIRGLLGTSGIGTIDQELMGVISSRHYPLRLFSMVDKVFIYDEIHAYDLYTSSLIFHLTAWQKKMGCPIIMLSASLPSNKKRELIEHYLGHEVEEMPVIEGYGIIVVDGDSGTVTHHPMPISDDEKKIVSIEKILNEEMASELILERIEDGGNVAWFCNSVQQCQDIYRSLKNKCSDDTEMRILHARFTPIKREKIEKELKEKFGKDGSKRPFKSILVTTQICETSLDLDFDLIVSWNAPMDSLIQRIGRLFRHSRESRPGKICHPSIIIIEPSSLDDGKLSFGKIDESIYERHILLETWNVLSRMTEIRVPDDVQEILDEVYQESNLSPIEESAFDKMMTEDEKMRYLANNAKIMDPSKNEDFIFLTKKIETDERMVTRYGSDTSLLIILREKDGKKYLFESGREIVPENEPNDDTPHQEIMGSSVPISIREVVNIISSKIPPGKLWRRTSGMKMARPICINEKESSKIISNMKLTYDDEFGLQISFIRD